MHDRLEPSNKPQGKIIKNDSHEAACMPCNFCKQYYVPLDRYWPFSA